MTTLTLAVVSAGLSQPSSTSLLATRLAARIRRAAREFTDLVAAREADAPADPFTDPVPFDQLLDAV